MAGQRETMEPSINWKAKFMLDRGTLSDVNYGIVPVHDNPCEPKGNKGIHWETGILLANLVERYRPPQIVELGTFQGYSTCWLLLGAAPFGGRVDAFEVFPEGHYGPMLYDSYRLRNDKFNYHHIPGGIWKYESQLPETIDFLYHDTEHLAGPTKKEMEILLPRIPVGGHIIIDDILHPFYPTMREYLHGLFKIALADSWTYEILPIGCGLAIAERKK
jgi:predicted O-methyltransferase YrrM